MKRIFVCALTLLMAVSMLFMSACGGEETKTKVSKSSATTVTTTVCNEDSTAATTQKDEVAESTTVPSSSTNTTTAKGESAATTTRTEPVLTKPTQTGTSAPKPTDPTSAFLAEFEGWLLNLTEYTTPTPKTVKVTDGTITVYTMTGAKNMARIRECMKTSTVTISTMAIALNAILNLVSLPILTIFAPSNPEVEEFARIKLVVNSSFYIMGHLEGLYGSAIRALGKSTLPMIVSVAGICGVRILWINTMFVWFRHPLTIFFAYGASWTITFIAQAIIYRRVQKQLGEKWEEEKNATPEGELAEASV